WSVSLSPCPQLPDGTALHPCDAADTMSEQQRARPPDQHPDHDAQSDPDTVVRWCVRRAATSDGKRQGEGRETCALCGGHPRRGTAQQHQQSIALVPPVKAVRAEYAARSVPVVHDRVRCGPDAPSGEAEAPCRVGVLVVAEETRRNATHGT